MSNGGGVLAGGAQDALVDVGVKLVQQQADEANIALAVGQLIGLGHDAGGLVLSPGADHHGGLDGVVGHLSRVVTGDGLGGSDVAQLVIQAGLVGVAANVHGPVGAHQTEHLGIVAHGGQEHLGGLLGSQGAAGVELTSAVAGDDAHAGAVLNVRLSPVIVDITVGGDDLGADVGLHAAVHHERDDLRHLGAGQSAIGVKVAAVVLTINDAQRHHGVDGLSVVDLTGIGEILARSAGGNDHHAHDQSHGHHQTESPLEVSHRKFLLLMPTIRAMAITRLRARLRFLIGNSSFLKFAHQGEETSPWNL